MIIRYNIVLSGVWYNSFAIVQLRQVYEKGYVSIGDSVSMDALESTVMNKNNVTILVIFGYEIVD